MKKLLCIVLMLTMSLTAMIPCLAADNSWTDKDMYGRSAPHIDGVKWLVAPTMAGKVEPIVYDAPDSSLYATQYYRFIGTHQGVINVFGDVVIPAKYASVGGGPGWLYASTSNDTRIASCYLFNLSGKQISNTAYKNAWDSSQVGKETFVFVNTADGKEACVRLSDGKEIIKDKGLTTFDSSGLAAFFCENGNCGYFTVDGKRVFAPSGFKSCIPSNGVLQCEYVSGSDQFRGIYTCDFKPILTIKDSNSQSITVDSKNKLVLIENFGDRYERNQSDVYDYTGKKTEKQWISDLPFGGFPDGYKISGELQSGYFENVLGLKNSSGVTVIPDKYSSIRFVKGEKNDCVICTTLNGSVFSGSISCDLYTLTGKKLTSISGLKLEPGEVYRWLRNYPGEYKYGVLVGTNTKDKNDWKNQYSVYNENGKNIVTPCMDVAVLPGGIESSTPVSGDNWYTRTTNFCDISGNVLKKNVGYYVESQVGSEIEQDLTIVDKNSDDLNSQKSGYCDGKFDLIIPCKFDAVTEFCNGQAFVKYEGKWGIIDNPLNTIAETSWSTYKK